MSITSIKTNAYENAIIFVCKAMGLFGTSVPVKIDEADDRVDKRIIRLDLKKSFDSKKAIYANRLQDLIIESLYINNPTSKAILENIDCYAEALARALYTLPVIVEEHRDEIFKRYQKFVLPPILAIFIKILVEHESNNSFYETLNDILLKMSAYGPKRPFSSIIQNILKAMLPEASGMEDFSPILQSINNIKDINKVNTRQLRDTINQKFMLVRSDLKLKKIPITPELDKSLNDLSAAYHCCMALLYFEKETYLLMELADFYRQLLNGKQIINCLDAELVRKHIVNVKDLNVKNSLSHSENLKNKIKPNRKHAIKTSSIKRGVRAISTLKERDRVIWVDFAELVPHDVHGVIAYALEDLTPFKNKPSTEIIGAVASQLNLPFNNYSYPPIDFKLAIELTNKGDGKLKPYMIIAEVCQLLNENRINDVITRLRCEDVLCIDQIPAPFIARTLTIFVGCLIKQKIYTGLKNPISKLIDTQRLYLDLEVDDQLTLDMSFNSFISDHHSITLLRAIREYNDIIKNIYSDDDSTHEQIIADTLDPIENKLAVFKQYSNKNQHEFISKLIKQKKLNAKPGAKLIRYLPHSTLYNCILELGNLRYYLHSTPKRHPMIWLLLENVEFRRAILKALKQAT